MRHVSLGRAPPPFLEHLYRRDTCYRHCECSDKTSTTVLALFRCAADSVGELRLTDEVSDRDESKDWDSAEHGCIKPSGPCGWKKSPCRNISSCTPYTPILNAKLIRFGPLWNKNPVFGGFFSFFLQTFTQNPENRKMACGYYPPSVCFMQPWSHSSNSS